jgi:hypothetical protein
MAALRPPNIYLRVTSQAEHVPMLRFFWQIRHSEVMPPFTGRLFENEMFVSARR